MFSSSFTCFFIELRFAGRVAEPKLAGGRAGVGHVENFLPVELLHDIHCPADVAAAVAPPVRPIVFAQPEGETPVVVVFV